MDEAHKLGIENGIIEPQSVNSRILFKTLHNAKTDMEKHNAVYECVRNYNAKGETDFPLSWGLHPLAELNGKYDWDFQQELMEHAEEYKTLSYILNKLIELGVDLEETDSEERTALIYAIEAGLEKAAIMLVRGGANTDDKTKEGETALELAEKKGMEGLKKWMEKRRKN